MAADENLEFVQQAYRAMADGDIPWLYAHTAEDVVFQQGGTFPTAGTFRGREAMFGHFNAFMTLVEGRFGIEPVDLLASDERVAAVIRVTIGLRGREIVFDEIHLWRVEDGLLREMHALPFDPYAVDAFFAGVATPVASA